MLSDINKRLVSSHGAIRYGVVITENECINKIETDSLRKKLISDRGPDIPMFNFGGTIEEIKSRCLDETKLEPPVAPTFIEL